jgi:phosphoglucomutase
LRHYKIYGRSFFSRYDYEEVESAAAQKLVDELEKAITTGSLVGTVHKSKSTGATFKIARTYNFNYTDPIDGSISKNQGQVVTFEDGSRVVWRLSGTGSQGATVRMYIERYLDKDADEKELTRDAQDGLKGLIDVALEFSKLPQYLGRDKPTVIT